MHDVDDCPNNRLSEGGTGVAPLTPETPLCEAASASTCPSIRTSRCIGRRRRRQADLYQLGDGYYTGCVIRQGDYADLPHGMPRMSSARVYADITQKKSPAGSPSCGAF